MSHSYLWNMRLLLFVVFMHLGSVHAQEDRAEDLLAKASNVYYSNPDSFLLYIQEADEYIHEGSTPEIKARLALSYGQYYLLKANLELAQEYINEGIHISEKYDAIWLSTWGYSLKAILLERLGKMDESISYMLKELSVYEQKKNENLVFSQLVSLLNAYIKLQDEETAAVTADTLQSMAKRLPEEVDYYFLQNMGRYYAMRDQYNGAIIYYDSAYRYTLHEDMIDARATILTIRAELKDEMGELNSALKDIREAVVISRGYELDHELGEALELQIELLQKNGDYEKAFEAQREFYELQNKLYDIEKISRINTIEEELKVAEKDRKLASQELSLEKEKLENEKAANRQTVLIYALSGAGVIGFVLLLGFLRVRKLNGIIEGQKKLVEEQKEMVQAALDDLHDSLHYSQRLQASILPDEKHFDQLFDRHFILYLPKDIVSGDFYWLEQTDEHTIVAVADSTGHGVPGAMVSMVCANALQKMAIEKECTDPAEILNGARDIIVKAFEQRDTRVLDGMDISIFSIKTEELTKEKKQIQWSGANNALWYTQGSEELKVIKPDKQPVGKSERNQPFTSHTIELSKGDILYLFTDGYADQFGGEKGKKFKQKELHKLLSRIHSRPLFEQHQMLDETFNKWKGDLEQLDDICIIGLRL